MLSKSRYLKGLKCHKALWLNHHKKEEAYYPASTIRKFEAGNTAGDIAQDHFPDGMLALVNDHPDADAAQKTQELLQKGVSSLYEATFIANRTLVALDILHQIDGKWYGFEVKSTNSVKHEHVRDAAIQFYVIQESGFDLEDIFIMHFDRTYVRQGAIDPKGLFTHKSVKTPLQHYLKDIPDNIETFLKVYQQEEPEILIGPHCDKPYECEFKNYCHELPENQKLLEAEKDTKPLGTDIIHKNETAIHEFLKNNPYPIFSLDLETVMYGIPQFDNSRPYQQIPFQYSLHYQKNAQTKPEHFEFLGNGIDDPREKLIQQLVNDLEKAGSILVYSPFEKRMIKELAIDHPRYENELNAILDRLVDLAPLFRKHIKTEATQSKYSLKIVQPTFLPHLSYQELNIQQGMAAMDAYKNLANLTKEEALEAKKSMLDYCKMDTLIVLELYKLLYDHV